MELLATQGDFGVGGGDDFLSQSREERKKSLLKRANKSGRKVKSAKGGGVEKNEMLDDPFQMARVGGEEELQQEGEEVEETSPLDFVLLEEEGEGEGDNLMEKAYIGSISVVSVKRSELQSDQLTALTG